MCDVFAIIIVTFLVGFIGYIFSHFGMVWYQTLILPFGTPPKWVFPLVWNIIFVCCAISAITALRLTKGFLRYGVIALYIANGVLNVLWSYLFFYKQAVGWALIDAFLIELTLIALIAVLYSISLFAAGLLLPYALWILYAIYLNFGVLILN